jgi:hypothetical protein
MLLICFATLGVQHILIFGEFFTIKTWFLSPPVLCFDYICKQGIILVHELLYTSASNMGMVIIFNIVNPEIIIYRVCAMFGLAGTFHLKHLLATSFPPIMFFIAQGKNFTLEILEELGISAH